MSVYSPEAIDLTRYNDTAFRLLASDVYLGLAQVPKGPERTYDGPSTVEEVMKQALSKTDLFSLIIDARTFHAENESLEFAETINKDELSLMVGKVGLITSSLGLKKNFDDVQEALRVALAVTDPDQTRGNRIIEIVIDRAWLEYGASGS